MLDASVASFLDKVRLFSMNNNLSTRKWLLRSMNTHNSLHFAWKRFFFLHNIHCWKTQKKANLHWIRRKNPERKGKEKNQNSTACSVTFIRFCDNADKLAIAKWCMIFQFVLSFYGKAKFRAIYDCRLNKKTWQSWNVQIFVCHVYFYSVSDHIHMSGMEYSNFVEQSASCRVEYTSNTCARRCLSVFLYNHRQFSPLSL